MGVRNGLESLSGMNRNGCPECVGIRKGLPPLIISIDETEILKLNDDNPSYPSIQENVMTAEYSRLIKEQLEALGDDEKPIDLLILVPGKNTIEYNWVIGALDNMTNEVAYLDYVNEDNRRFIARTSMVRVCTYHSSRGIEGTRVLIFGFERILSLAEKTNTKPENLSYIALSRTLFECIVAVRNSFNSSSVSFLKQVIGKLPK